MSTRLIPVAGAVLGLLLAFLVVLGVAVDQPVLAAAAAALLGAAILAVQVDSWRRIRSQRNFLRDEIRRNSRQGRRPSAATQPDGKETLAQGSAFVSPSPVPVAQQEDVLGAIRVLQAQYTGRLDRMQRTLEDALEQISAQRSDHDGQ